MIDTAIILASRSAARRAILGEAGVRIEVVDAGVDEDALKRALRQEHPVTLAVRLAEAKALAVSRARPEAWVIGADQTLAFDGGLIDKCRDMAEARARLTAFRGRDHVLHSGAALALNGQILWAGADSATLRMRTFSDEFLDAYLAREGEALLGCVGAYRLEGLGAQLFDQVGGDYFTVLGLPLWPLLAELRRVGALRS